MTNFVPTINWKFWVIGHEWYLMDVSWDFSYISDFKCYELAFRLWLRSLILFKIALHLHLFHFMIQGWLRILQVIVISLLYNFFSVFPVLIQNHKANHFCGLKLHIFWLFNRSHESVVYFKKNKKMSGARTNEKPKLY
jgi:hypothetical protein